MGLERIREAIELPSRLYKAKLTENLTAGGDALASILFKDTLDVSTKTYRVYDPNEIGGSTNDIVSVRWAHDAGRFEIVGTPGSSSATAKAYGAAELASAVDYTTETTENLNFTSVTAEENGMIVTTGTSDTFEVPRTGDYLIGCVIYGFASGHGSAPSQLQVAGAWGLSLAEIAGAIGEIKAALFEYPTFPYGLASSLAMNVVVPLTAGASFGITLFHSTIDNQVTIDEGSAWILEL